MKVSIIALTPIVLSLLVDAKKHGRRDCHRRHHAKLTLSGSGGDSTSPASSTAASISTINAALAAKGDSRNPKGQSTWASTSASWSPTSASRSSTVKTTATSSAAQSSSTSSSSSTGWGLSGTNIEQIYFGILPDDGSGGGTAMSINQINGLLGLSAMPAQGWYAQARSGTTFDGSQLLSRKSEIVAAGGVFQPAIMPTGGWQGLTSDDNSQAVAICTVLKEFTDAGLEVWLRFAHEVNWYQQDGTYEGNANDFKEGWATVAAACKSIAPSVKMWFTPNIASLSVYQEYFPDDVSTVDLIGIDYYPNDLSNLDFVGAMQSFHDAYTSDSLKFAIGETGLGMGAGISSRLAWAKAIFSSSTKSALPNMIACSWFNYYKGYDFRLAGDSSDSAATAAWLASAAS